MADGRQQQSLMADQDVSVPDELSQIGSLQNPFEGKKLVAVSSTNILQQALQEADGYSQASSHSNIQKSILHENVHHLTDHSYIHPSHTNINVPHCDISPHDTDSSDTCLKQDNPSKDLQSSVSLESANLVSESNTTQIVETSNFPRESDKISLNGDALSPSTARNNNDINVLADIEAITNSHSADNSPTCAKSVIETPVTDSFDPVFVVNKLDSKTLTVSSPSSSQDVASLKVPVRQTNAPLGSVENPIQVIRTDTGLITNQNLTPAQRHQILHVLHKEQSWKALETKGETLAYDSSTHHKVLCRLINPPECPSSTESTPKGPPPPPRQSNLLRGRGRPKKFQTRKTKEEDKGNNTMLSKEEREEKKKHRPRTRSGRISKPPSYMVKDYKRIHHLDFNEEPYDDSDGGYSDYHVSDDENEKRAPKTKNLPPGVTTAKQRNYSCQSCSKAYIGRGGLSRHYRTHPSHGSMVDGEDNSTQDENSNSSMASSVLSNSGGNTNNQTFSSAANNIASNSNSNSQPAAISSQLDPPKIAPEEPPPVQALSQTSNILASNRRKARLREVLKNYPDQDIIDVLLPKFAQDVPLWDFFSAKFSKNRDNLSIFEMLKEFEKFISHMKVESHKCLSPVNLQDSEGKTIINISSNVIASALSLETGPYMVKSSSTGTESGFKTASKSFKPNNSANDELGMPNDAPLFKRKRLEVSVEDVSSGLPEQILSDVIPESDNLDLPLSEEHLSSTVEFTTQDVHLLSSSMSVDSQSDIVSKALYDIGSSTIVTPSSLSAGCLSAVNAPRTQQISILGTRSPQKVQNLQFRRLQVLGTPQQQLLPPSDITISVPVSDLPVSVDCSLTDLSSAAQQIMNKDPVIVQKTMEMCNGSIVGKNFQGLPLDSNMDIFNSSIQGLPPQSAILDSNTESNHAATSVSLINTADVHNQNVPSDTSQTTSVQTELVENIANCLSDPRIVSSLQNSNSIVSTGLPALVPSEISMSTNVTEEAREFESTHNVIPEVPKLPESSALLSHVMLPDGQVISIWSPMENNEKVPNEQFVQNFVPGNLIILQNPDGSIQVPNHQGVPAETLQTVTTLNQGFNNESGTQAFTSVQHM